MSFESQRARDIFVNAVGKVPRDDWDVYVAEACDGDPVLLERVQQLLRAHAEAGSVQEGAASNPQMLSKGYPVRERAGSIIGPYKLLEEIGEGGFGVVFMAEQQHPVRRRVALKVIKPGMDTRQVIARFEAERQALALMEHPNIARVLDAGETDSGLPYFVMELVRGIPITDFCDQQHLTPAARLQLFMAVCQAVQHAHQKGIIHRDLKPANVLVTLHDGTPVPKVIDFGIAKATGQQLTEKTLFTNFAQMVGTPLYMSPEQAALSALDVDTRSDVYSLGVLLYELLTGTTPFDKERLRTAAYDEICRIIREEEPPRPSKRLSELSSYHPPSEKVTRDLTVTLASISAQRHTAPAQLTRLLRGELDWIVMKCLEKDRNRRYETAKDLVADLQRYLSDQPVQACPPSAGYLLRKLVRRNKGAVLAVAVIVLLLIGAVTGTTWGLVRAEQAWQAETIQRRLAEDNEQKALAAAEAQRQAKEAAQMRFAETMAVLDFVENKVFAAARPKGQEGGLGRQVSLREAVEAALPFVEGSFSKQPLIEARLRSTMAKSFFFLGDAKTAAGQFQIARNLYAQHCGPDHSDTLAVTQSLANSYDALGRYGDALKLREETLTHCQAKFGPEHSQTLAAMNNLANSYAALGRGEDALKLREQTLALRKTKLGPNDPETLQSMLNLANSYSTLGQQEAAFKLREETLALCQATLGPEHPHTLHCMNNLANSYSALGRRQEALKLREETLALRKAKLGPEHPDTLVSMNNLANSYAALGRRQEALQLREETLALRRAKLGPDHLDTLESMSNLAISYYALGRHDEALKLREEKLTVCRANLGSDHPETLDSMLHLSSSYVALGRHEEALKLREQTLKLRKAQFGPDHPDTLKAVHALAWVLATAPDSKLRDPARAVALAAEAVAASPQTPNYHTTLGIARYRAGDWKAAVLDLEKAIGLPKANDSHKAASCFFLAMAHWQLGAKETARRFYDAAAQRMDQGDLKDPDLKRFRAEAVELLGVKNKS